MSLRPARAAMLAGAALVLYFGVDRFLHPVGGRAPIQYWWLTTVAFGIAVVAVSAFTRWTQSGLVAATLIVGISAQLALKEPLWFQHLEGFPRSRFSVLMWCIMGGQATVAMVVWLRKGLIRRGLRVAAELGWLRVGCAALILCAGSMSAMDYLARHQYPRLLKELVMASALAGLNVVSFVALLAVVPASDLRRLGDFVSRRVSLPGAADQERAFDRALPWWLAAGVFVVCVFLRLVVFENIPRLDEVGYVFQATYQAHGKLTLPLPPSLEAFHTSMALTNGDRWFATWLPGWPFVLAVGIFFGAPWIVNPLLAAVNILLLHSFVKSVSGRGMGNLVTLLAAFSPWFLWTASTLMPHTLTYALVLGAWVLLLKARRQPSFWAPAIAGALMGLHFLTRPLEAVVMGGVTGLWTLSFLRDRKQWKTVLAYGVGCMAIGGLMFPYNAHLLGDPFTIPMNVYFDGEWGPGRNRLGFAPDIGAQPMWFPADPFPGHSPLEALVQSQQMFYSLNAEFLGWAVGSVSFAVVFLLWGKWSRVTIAMALIAVLTVAVLSLYWFAAFGYAGPRYWYMVLVPMLILTGAGLSTCAERFARIFPEDLIPQRIGAGVSFLTATSMLVFSSWLAFNKYPEYKGYHTDYRELAGQDRFKNSVVFVRTKNHIEYANAFALNDFADPSERPIFAKDTDAETNRIVAQAYPGRNVYVVAGRDRTRRHVEILSGPDPTPAEPSRPD